MPASTLSQWSLCAVEKKFLIHGTPHPAYIVHAAASLNPWTVYFQTGHIQSCKSKKSQNDFLQDVRKVHGGEIGEKTIMGNPM